MDEINGALKNKAVWIGDGAYPTANAQTTARKGYEVRIIGLDPNPEAVNQLQDGHNTKYLRSAFQQPGSRIHRNVSAHHLDLSMIDNAAFVVYAVPSEFFEQAVRDSRPYIKPGMKIGIQSKGVVVYDDDTFDKFSDIALKVLGEQGITRDDIAVAVGPDHAELHYGEEGQVGLVVASTRYRTKTRRRVEASIDGTRDRFKGVSDLRGKYFGLEDLLRKDSSITTFTSGDVTGVQLAATLKNPAAIASGMLNAMGATLDETISFIVNVMNENAQIAVGYNRRENVDTLEKADPATFYGGLAGLGDLLVTCLSEHSRNYTLGSYIIQEAGRTETGFMEKALTRLAPKVSEGYRAARITSKLAEEAGVADSIHKAVHSILYQDARPDTLRRFTELRDHEDRFKDLISESYRKTAKYRDAPAENSDISKIIAIIAGYLRAEGGTEHKRDNTVAFLVTRGLAEVALYARRQGQDVSSVYSGAVLKDYLMQCYGDNVYTELGRKIFEGKFDELSEDPAFGKINNILDTMNRPVIERVMPLTRLVYDAFQNDGMYRIDNSVQQLLGTGRVEREASKFTGILRVR